MLSRPAIAAEVFLSTNSPRGLAGGGGRGALAVYVAYIIRVVGTGCGGECCSSGRIVAIYWACGPPAMGWPKDRVAVFREWEPAVRSYTCLIRFSSPLLSIAPKGDSSSATRESAELGPDIARIGPVGTNKKRTDARAPRLGSSVQWVRQGGVFSEYYRVADSQKRKHGAGWSLGRLAEPGPAYFHDPDGLNPSLRVVTRELVWQPAGWRVEFARCVKDPTKMPKTPAPRSCRPGGSRWLSGLRREAERQALLHFAHRWPSFA